MHAAYEHLQGLDRDRLVALIEPVLSAHGVEPVELIWRSDSRGWVLYLTVERQGSREPGAGVTLDLCAEISRDLSTALDVEDLIPGKYRLEVGSPGVERALYGLEDYVRFSGQKAKIRLREPREGQKVLRGVLWGKNDDGDVLLAIEDRKLAISPDQIQSGQLIFDWRRTNGSSATHSPRRGARRHASQRNR